jgi:hypothetical protein
MKESSSNATNSGSANSGGAAPVDSSSLSSRGGGRGADFAALLSFTTPSASTSPRRMTRERLVQLLDEAMHIASGGDLDGDDDDSLAMLLRTRAAIRPSCPNRDGGRAHE